MLALLTVLGCFWDVDFLPTEDWIEVDERTSDQEWSDWLLFAVHFQAARGGGTFVAGAPVAA